MRFRLIARQRSQAPNSQNELPKPIQQHFHDVSQARRALRDWLKLYPPQTHSLELAYKLWVPIDYTFDDAIQGNFPFSGFKVTPDASIPPGQAIFTDSLTNPDPEKTCVITNLTEINTESHA